MTGWTRRNWIEVLLLSCLLGTVATPSLWPGNDETPSSQILIRFKSHVGEALAQQILSEHNLELIKALPLPNLYLCKKSSVSTQTLEEVLRRLNSHPEVQYAEPDHEVKALDAAKGGP